MDWFDRWRERREREWLERWKREHRWDALADYNARVSKGIVHTSEYAARMREEQRLFNEEHGRPGDRGGFPFTLESGESMTVGVPIGDKR